MTVDMRRIVGVIAILFGVSAIAGFAYGSLGQNLVYYWSPTELAAKGQAAEGATVRLGGLVVPGSFDMTKCNPGCTFKISDGTTEVPVRTSGLPPQMFREGIGVVVEGQLHGDVFETERVMVKHSNEYRAPSAGGDPMRTLAEGTE